MRSTVSSWKHQSTCSVHRPMSMSKNCRTGCSTGGPGSSGASGLKNMAGGCCGRLLGGKTFRDERVIRGRVHDIGRRCASFFPNPCKQPGLRCCGRPILLRVTVREVAGPEGDGAQLGGTVATPVVAMHEPEPGRGR